MLPPCFSIFLLLACPAFLYFFLFFCHSPFPPPLRSGLSSCLYLCTCQTQLHALLFTLLHWYIHHLRSCLPHLPTCSTDLGIVGSYSLVTALSSFFLTQPRVLPTLVSHFNCLSNVVVSLVSCHSIRYQFTPISVISDFLVYPSVFF